MPKTRHLQFDLFEKAHATLRQSNRVLIVMHQKPDGDALGSALALSHYCGDIGKPHDVFCVHKAPDHYGYLPHIERINTNPELLTHGSHDTLVTLDSGDLVYAGIYEHLEKRMRPEHLMINIDHHPTNTHYGDINIVDPDSSSASEIMYHFLRHVDHPMDSDIATLMLTGIITDTGGFSNLATTSSSLDVASDLLSRGARIWDIQANTSKNKSINALKVWGIILSRLRKHESGVVSTILTLDDLAKHSTTVEHIEGIANFLNSIEGARAVILISEVEKGKIKVSMRSTTPGVDVSRLAQTFGGGGHMKASGLSLPGHIETYKDFFHIV